MRLTVCEQADDVERRKAAWEEQICTEMLFTDLAWNIGRAGAHIIAAPRATGGHRRWRLAASLMGIVSGCFVASANRRSYVVSAQSTRTVIASDDPAGWSELIRAGQVSTVSKGLS